MSKLTERDIMAAIQSCVSPDLLSTKWRQIVDNKHAEDKHAVSGHCAIAAEALYDMLGGAAAGYTPYVCGYYFDEHNTRHFAKAPKGYVHRTHWWIKAPKGGVRGGGEILDPTVHQYKALFPYENGMACGFMSPNPPSKRARILIARVEEMLGAKAVNDLRKEKIKAFEETGGRANLSKTAIMQRRRAMARRF